MDQVSTLLTVFGRLYRGPDSVVELFGDSARFNGGLIVTAVDRDRPVFRLGGVDFIAFEFPSLLSSFDRAIANWDPPHADALSVLRGELEARWRDWFATVGADHLRTLNRLAGPDAVVSPIGMLLELPEVLPPSSPHLALDAFRVLAGAHLGGEADPTAAALEVLLDHPKLFSNGFVNTGADELRELIDEVKDFAELNARVRESANRRSAEAVVGWLTAQARPDRGAEGRNLVLATIKAWNVMFWSKALGYCFPTVTRAVGRC